MTFDNDFVQLDIGTRELRIRCKDLGISWPPPPALQVLGSTFTLRRHSHITDEQRAGMTHVCRGAQYSTDSTELAATEPAKLQ